MPGSEGMSTAADWAGSVDQSSARREAISRVATVRVGRASCAPGRGPAGAVVVVVAGAVVGAPPRRDPDRTAAVVHMRCRLDPVLGRRDVVALSL